MAKVVIVGLLLVVVYVTLIHSTCSNHAPVLPVSFNEANSYPDELASDRPKRDTAEVAIKNIDEDRSQLRKSASDGEPIPEQVQPDEDAIQLEWVKKRILGQLGIENPDEMPKPPFSALERNKLIVEHHRRYNMTPETHNPRHKRLIHCSKIKPGFDVCCLTKFYVNFSKMGWAKFIISPVGYWANYCSGMCDITHVRYHHTAVIQKWIGMRNLCCSPKHLSSLKLLFYTKDNVTEEKDVEQMVAEDCNCS